MALDQVPTSGIDADPELIDPDVRELRLRSPRPVLPILPELSVLPVECDEVSVPGTSGEL